MEYLRQQIAINVFPLVRGVQAWLGMSQYPSIGWQGRRVFPSMIEESPDRDAEGNDLGTTTKSVKYSVFVPMLIKAIQEQQAIIIDLQARLTKAGL